MAPPLWKHTHTCRHFLDDFISWIGAIFSFLWASLNIVSSSPGSILVVCFLSFHFFSLLWSFYIFTPAFISPCCFFITISLTINLVAWHNHKRRGPAHSFHALYFNINLSAIFCYQARQHYYYTTTAATFRPLIGRLLSQYVDCLQILWMYVVIGW